MFGYITLLFSLPDYGKSIGLADSQATTEVAAFVNLGIAVGRPLIGIASDKLGRFRVAIVLTFFCSIMCFALWIPAKSYPALVVFALLSGEVLGTFWAVGRFISSTIFDILILQKVIGPLITELVGLENLPSLLSITWIVIILPVTCKMESHLLSATFRLIRTYP